MNLKQVLFIRGLYGLFQRYFIKRSNFGFIAKSARITPPCSLSCAKNIFIDEGCTIDSNSLLYATHAIIRFKKNVICAKGLNVVTGAHERRIGRFCVDITDKEKDLTKQLDKDVTIEEDVWIGLNVTIMPGVIIGRGSNIGASSVVTKSVPPYSISAGAPARFIRFYWSINEIIEHEKSLYKESDRLSREYLDTLFKKYDK